MIENLPLEIMVQIFQLLDRSDWHSILSTSRKFNKASKIVVDPSINNNFAIVFCSERGNHVAVKSLMVDQRVDPRARGGAAIKLASANGHSEVVKLLLNEIGYDDEELEFSVTIAMYNGHKEVLLEILKDGRVDIDKNGNRLKWAAANRDIEVISAILKYIPHRRYNAQVGEKEKKKRTFIVGTM